MGGWEAAVGGARAGKSRGHILRLGGPPAIQHACQPGKLPSRRRTAHGLDRDGAGQGPQVAAGAAGQGGGTRGGTRLRRLAPRAPRGSLQRASPPWPCHHCPAACPARDHRKVHLYLQHQEQQQSCSSATGAGTRPNPHAPPPTCRPPRACRQTPGPPPPTHTHRGRAPHSQLAAAQRQGPQSGVLTRSTGTSASPAPARREPPPAPRWHPSWTRARSCVGARRVQGGTVGGAAQAWATAGGCTHIRLRGRRAPWAQPRG